MSRSALNALKKLLSNRVNSGGFESTVFKTLQVVSGGEGKCCCELKVTEQMVNSKGTLHGGVMVSLVDCVSTYALSTISTGELGVSTDINVSFMRPANINDTVVIQAATLSRGKTMAVCSIDITNKATGKLLAQGRHSKYMIEQNLQHKA